MTAEPIVQISRARPIALDRSDKTLRITISTRRDGNFARWQQRGAPELENFHDMGDGGRERTP